jgi:hypothetical protein
MSSNRHISGANGNQPITIHLQRLSRRTTNCRETTDSQTIA